VLTQEQQDSHAVQYKPGCAAYTYCKQTKQKFCLTKLLCRQKKVKPALLVACVLCTLNACLSAVSRCYHMTVALLLFKPRVIQSFGTICSFNLRARRREAQAADIADAPQSTQDAQQHSRPAFDAATISVTTEPWLGHPTVQSLSTPFAKASDQHQVMTAMGRSLAMAATRMLSS